MNAAGPSSEQAHRRLVHLYEISKLLVDFDGVEHTLPKVIAIVAETLPLSSAIFILETATRPATILWKAEDETAVELREADARAKEAYRYLVRSVVDLENGGVASSRAGGEGRRLAVTSKKSFLILPLAVGRSIFGAAQFELRSQPDEVDLIFVNAVVNQLAIAIDRGKAIDARQALAESGRAQAEERRAVAEESEARIRDRHDFARSVTASIGKGVLAVDLEERVTLFNPAAEEMLGWPADMALGMRASEILRIRSAKGSSVVEAEWPFERVIAGGESLRVEDLLLSGRGARTFPVSYTAAPIRQAGRIVGAVLVFEDITARREGERALIESEERYRTLFGSAPMAVLVCDRDGVIRAHNQRATELWGREGTEEAERHWDTMNLRFPDGTRVLRTSTPLAEVLHGGAPAFNVEMSIERSDGRRIPAIVNFAALKDARGGITGAIATFVDIADRKKAEEELRDAAERFRFLAESMPQKIATADPRGEVYYFNEQWTEFTGVSADNLLSEGWSQVIHPDDVEESVRKWEHAIEIGEHFELEHRFRRADGRYHWHLSRARPMRDADGNIRMWIGSSTDIDLQKHAETTQRFLAEAAAILSSSLDYRKTLAAVVRLAVPTLADVCFIDELGEDGKLQRFEVAFADERKRILADRIKRVLPRRGWPPVLEMVLTSGEARLFESPAAKDLAHDESDAEVMRILDPKSLMIVPLVARGRTLGALKFITAESGRRYTFADLAFAEGLSRIAAMAIDNARLYEHAQAAIAARENLLSVVSHDLRNPLGLILMSLTILLQTAEHGERRQSRRYHLNIQRAANRMNRLIEDLLDTASIEGDRLSVDKSRLELGPLATEALDALAPLALGKSLSFRSEIPADLPAVWADSGRIHQVLANLLGNAIKFTPPGGTIVVRAESAGETVTCSVADTGPGIPEEDLPYLFDRLWQAKRTARLGTGLGLFIVNGIVKAHGGRLWVESTMGHGSTFFFTLPVAASLGDGRVEGSGSTSARPGVRKVDLEAESRRLDKPAENLARLRK